MTITLKNDNTVALEHIYAILEVKIKSCHDGTATLLPNLATLVPTHSFAPIMLPPTSYNRYHEVLAFFKRLSNYICYMLEDSIFAANTPASYQGLYFIESSEANGFDMLFCMLSHTISHIVALGFNSQKLIDSLVWMNIDDMYDSVVSA